MFALTVTSGVVGIGLLWALAIGLLGGMPERVRMSALFDLHQTLILYSFMYGPQRDEPCDGCTHQLDCMDGAARHIGQRAAMYIVAQSPIARLVAWAKDRGWPHLQFLSTVGNRYDADYFGDTSKLPASLRAERELADDENWEEPVFNVFRLDDGKVRHFWGSEMVFAPTEPNQDHRAGDSVAGVWNLLDMTPEGRGKFYPKLRYE